MKNRFALFYSLSVVFVSSVYAGKYDTYLEKGAHSCPSIAYAIDDAQRYRAAAVAEFDHLRSRIVELYQDDTKQATEPGIIQKHCETWIDLQLSFAKRFNAARVPGLSPQLMVNRVEEVLTLAQTFMTEQNLSELIEGRLPAAYDYHTTETAILGLDEATIWGSAKGPQLHMALLTLIRILGGKSALLEEFSKVDTSPGLNLVAFPKSFYDSLTDLADYEFIFSDDLTPYGLMTIHQGYAWGGIRGDKIRYPESKIFAAHDCSSYVAHFSGIAQTYENFSTVDALFVKRLQSGQEMLAPIQENFKRWVSSAEGVMLNQRFRFIPLEHVTESIVHIYGHRGGFKNDEDPEHIRSLGTGGHITFALGIEQDSVITLGANRDWPTIEGVGVQEFPLTGERMPSNREALFFELVQGP